MTAAGNRAAAAAVEYLGHLGVVTRAGVFTCADGWNTRDWVTVTNDTDPEVHQAALEVLRRAVTDP
jgi:hypothetical protein